MATPLGLRLQLHFLPPYCPDHNRIERSRQDLHANTTNWLPSASGLEPNAYSR